MARTEPNSCSLPQSIAEFIAKLSVFLYYRIFVFRPVVCSCRGVQIPIIAGDRVDR